MENLTATEVLYAGETLSRRFSDAEQHITATLTLEPTGEADDAGPQTVTLHVARIDDDEVAWIQRDGLWTVGRVENLWDLLNADLQQRETTEPDEPEPDNMPMPFAPPTP
jgi:hypothetical protein